MKKALLILPVLLCAACDRESDINPWCIENVDAVQVYKIEEYTDGKYAWSSTCNVKDVDTKKCIGGRVVISMAQMPDIKIGQTIKAPKDGCFAFSYSNMPPKTADGKTEPFWPLVEFTAKNYISTRKGYNYWYKFTYETCMNEHSQEKQFNTKHLCVCITNGVMNKVFEMYANNQYKLEDSNFESENEAKCKTLSDSALKSMKKIPFNHQIVLPGTRRHIINAPDNRENPECIKDIRSVLAVKSVGGESDDWLGVICRNKEADNGFCLGETVVLLSDAFNNLQRGKMVVPSKDQCFVYSHYTDRKIIVNDKKQNIKVLAQDTKHSIFTEKGYQLQYKEFYNRCIHLAEGLPEYDKYKEMHKLMCECKADVITDSLRDVASIKNKPMKWLSEKFILWRINNGVDVRCGPGTEVFQKVKELRNPE